MQGTANLEFWETYDNPEVINYLIQANNLLREIVAAERKADTTLATSTVTSELPADTTTTSKSLEELISSDSSQQEATTREEFNLQNPLFGILNPRVTEQGQPLPSSMVGLAAGLDTALVNSYLSMNQVRALFPATFSFAGVRVRTNMTRPAHFMNFMPSRSQPATGEHRLRVM